MQTMCAEHSLKEVPMDTQQEFQKFYQENLGLIYRYVYNQVSNREEAEDLTVNNDGLILVVAFNYGARDEIARAVRRIAEDVASGRLKPEAVTAELIGQRLDAPDLTDPDLIIRTSGEQRLSNFLLWQAAYSELVFVPTYWPDFDRAALEFAIREYQQRERRFGGLVAQTGS